MIWIDGADAQQRLADVIVLRHDTRVGVLLELRRVVVGVEYVDGQRQHGDIRLALDGRIERLDLEPVLVTRLAVERALNLNERVNVVTRVDGQVE